MFVWIVYDFVEDKLLGAYNADIWKRLDVSDEIMRLHDVTKEYLEESCDFYYEEVL